MQAKFIGFLGFLIFLALGYFIFFESELFSKTEKATGYFHRDGRYCGITASTELQPGTYPELQYFKINNGRLPVSPENYGTAPLIQFSALFDREFCEKSTIADVGTHIEMTGKRVSSNDGLGHTLSNVDVFEVSSIERIK